MSASTESMPDFRVTSIDFQTMLEDCLTSATVQNGGEGYITDTPKDTQPEDNVTDAFDQIPDLLSSIIDAVGIPQSEELDTKPRILDEATTMADPSENKHKECPIELQQRQQQQQKPAPEAFIAQLQPKRQMTITDDGDIEFILHPAPAVPLHETFQLLPQGLNNHQPAQHEQLQQQPATEEFIAQLQQNKQITITEDGDIELVLPPPHAPMEPQADQIQLQHPVQQNTNSLPTETPINQQHIEILDLELLPQIKCVLPVTLEDDNSEQQIVVRVNATNFVLPTIYQLQTELDERPIMHITPTSLPDTIHLTPQGLTKTPLNSPVNNLQQANSQMIPNPSIPEADRFADIEDHILPKFMITTVLAGSAIVKPAPHIQQQQIVHIPAKRSTQSPASCKPAENGDPSRPFKCTEDGCIKAFTRKEHLLRHLIAHSGEKMFTCDICLKLFTRKDNLKKHKRYHLRIARAALKDESHNVEDVNMSEISQKQHEQLNEEIEHELQILLQDTLALNNTTDTRECTPEECAIEPQPQKQQEQNQQQQGQQKQEHQESIAEDASIDLFLPSPPAQMEPHPQQHPHLQTTISLPTPINQQHTEIEDFEMLPPKKRFLAITLKDHDSDQQIVAHIDATNCVLSTITELQPRHIPPRAFLEALQLAPKGLTQQEQQQHDQQNEVMEPMAQILHQHTLPLDEANETKKSNGTTTAKATVGIRNSFRN